MQKIAPSQLESNNKLLMRLSDGTRFDLDRKVLTFYDSSKPYPHCNTRIHINETRIDQLKHLPIDEIMELLSHVDRNYQAPDPFERENPKTRAREVYTALWYEMLWWWSLDRDEHNMKIEEWMYKYQPNQHYIFYKSCATRKYRR